MRARGEEGNSSELDPYSHEWSLRLVQLDDGLFGLSPLSSVRGSLFPFPRLPGRVVNVSFPPMGNLTLSRV